MVEIIKTNREDLEKRLKSVDNWNVPQKVKKDIRDFCWQASLGKVNKGFKISEQRQVKYINLLKIPLEYFKKEIEKITDKDLENFEKDLTTGKIKSKLKNAPYSENTQADIKKIIKLFFRWKLGTVKATELVGWLDTRDKKKTPDYLKESEIEKLYKSCKSARERFLIAILFDSGARAQEFLNIRYEDIEMPTKEKNFVKITLKEEYSKTQGRVISLYWKNSLEAVNDFIQERKEEGIKSQEPVFNMNYDATRMFLYRLGKKALHKQIYPHLFRHSSATFYASKLNRQELCYRYGWKFSSDMPDVYISRAGMQNKDLDDKFETTELSEVKSQLNKADYERKKTQEEIELIKQELEKRKLLDPFLNELIKNPSFKKMAIKTFKKIGPINIPEP